MTDEPQPSFSQQMTARVAAEERRDHRCKSKGTKLIRSVLLADLATLPSDVAAARRELEAEYGKEPKE